MVQIDESMDINTKLREMNLEYEVEFVESEDHLVRAVEDISSSNAFAFDCEGVDLGRSGPLTIATFSSLDSSTIYVIDVQVIGADRVFSKSKPSCRALLESNKAKVMFDCRSDSDALFHQFGVKLSGVLDMQIFDQAVRIYNGEALPERCGYLYPPYIPRLSNMNNVASRYGLSTAKMSAPHVYNAKVWSQRPLDAKAVAYAAQDAHIIKLIYRAAKDRVPSTSASGDGRTALWSSLEKAVTSHSKRYEALFRDRDTEVNRVLEKDFITEEIAIIHCSRLPSNHPNKISSHQSKGKEKWDFAIKALRSKTTSSNTNDVFHSVLFILQHDEWYTDEAFTLLRKLAGKYPYFTARQRDLISCPPALPREEDWEEDYWGDY